MASIFKRGSGGIWYIKYYVNGRQVYESLDTTSERLAQRMKREIEADEVAGRLQAPSKIPLSEFLAQVPKLRGENGVFDSAKAAFRQKS